MSKVDVFALVEAIVALQPTEYLATFQRPDYFAEYGYKSTGSPGFKWVWFRQRLLQETVEELQRLYRLVQ